MQGGLNRYVSGLVDEFREQERPFEIHAVSSHLDSRYGSTRATSLLKRAWSFARTGWTEAPRVDVVNVHFALYGLPYLVGNRLRIGFSKRGAPKVVVHFHGPWAEESRAAGEGRLVVSFKRAVERIVLRQAQHVIVLSEEFQRVARESYRVPNGKLSVVPPGIDKRWFTRGPEDLSTHRDEVELVCVRRLTPRMGHIELLDLLESVDFKVDDRPIGLSIIGRGDQEGTLMTWVSAHAREDRVRILGSLTDEELISRLDAADVSVVPTLALEGFGLVVLEAMARGLPVVSTGQGGLREAMGPWGTQPYVFSLSSAEELTEGVRRAAADRENPHARANLITYAAGFSWSAVVQRLQEIVS